MRLGFGGNSRIRRTKAEQLEGVQFTSAKKVAHNTVEYLRSDGTRVIRLHLTDIVEFLADGSVRLSTGGFKTLTTKERLNKYVPKPWIVWANKGIWYIGKAGIPGSYVFSDGVVIHPNGNISGLDPDEEVRCKELSKKILKYCKAMSKLEKLPKPDGGDCWLCLLRTTDGKSLDESTSHLESHLDDLYFIGSLIVQAMRWAGCNDYMISSAFYDGIRPATHNHAMRAMRRYLRACFGLSR